MWMLGLAAVQATPLPRPPPGVEVDGDLREWTGAPYGSLGETQILRGFEPPSSAEDTSATVWLAFDPQRGLFVAVRVRDEAVLLAGPGASDARIVRSDHAELRVTFGDPQLPPIGWGVGIGDITLSRPEDCHKEEYEFDCPSWFREQVALRAGITERFRPQFVLSDQGLAPVQSGALEAPIGQGRIRAVPGGWEGEALLPLAALPPTPVEPVASVRVLVDLVDQDRGYDRQETFLSWGRSADPGTWRLSPLDAPLAAAHPSGLAQRLVGTDGWWRESDPGALRLHRYLNYSVGYQWEPRYTSPIVWDLALGEPRWTFGALGVWTVSTPRQDFVAAGIDGRSVGYLALGAGNAIERVQVGDVPLIIATRATFLGEFGARPGSAYGLIVLRVFRPDPAGTFTTVLNEEIELEGGAELAIGRVGDRLAGLRATPGLGEEVFWRWTGTAFTAGEPAGEVTWSPALRTP